VTLRDDPLVNPYLRLSSLDIATQLRRLLDRPVYAAGARQEPFLPVETLLCYGLFLVLDPHRYGGRNMHQLPSAAVALAGLFRRSPSSVLYKMLNLDGSRANSARAEPALFALLSSRTDLFPALYIAILSVARELGISGDVLPDFLGSLQPDSASLLGQEELPATSTEVLALEPHQDELPVLTLALDDDTTEQLLVGRVRLAQHRFAHDVLANWQRACAFCGFAPRRLPEQSGLLRASHIKPWARSSAWERRDVGNGFSACPIHDAAFDRGYITVLPDYRIVRSALLEASLRSEDPRARLYFQDALWDQITAPPGGQPPGRSYLEYHRDYIYQR
jgi:putative restriction endonuclease